MYLSFFAKEEWCASLFFFFFFFLAKECGVLVLSFEKKNDMLVCICKQRMVCLSHFLCKDRMMC